MSSISKAFSNLPCAKTRFEVFLSLVRGYRLRKAIYVFKKARLDCGDPVGPNLFHLGLGADPTILRVGGKPSAIFITDGVQLHKLFARAHHKLGAEKSPCTASGPARLLSVIAEKDRCP